MQGPITAITADVSNTATFLFCIAMGLHLHGSQQQPLGQQGQQGRQLKVMHLYTTCFSTYGQQKRVVKTTNIMKIVGELFLFHYGVDRWRTSRIRHIATHEPDGPGSAQSDGPGSAQSDIFVRDRFVTRGYLTDL